MTLTGFEMVERVNEKLPEEKQFETFGLISLQEIPTPSRISKDLSGRTPSVEGPGTHSADVYW
jgi:hypothetical protein